jgi:hypothetical protein
MRAVYRSVAGIDVHKKMPAVVVRWRHGGKSSISGGSSAPTGLKGGGEVVMESTAQYRRPVWKEVLAGKRVER